MTKSIDLSKYAKGKGLLCANGSPRSLTKGQVYESLGLDASGRYVTVKDDNGAVQDGWDRSRFVPVEDEAPERAIVIEPTKAHRELAVRAMFPDASTVSPIWAWVERGDAEGGGATPTSRVAQAFAGFEASIRVELQAGEVGQIVNGRAKDGRVYYEIEFPDTGRVPGVGAMVRVTREAK
jgi:hypothetical protein